MDYSNLKETLVEIKKRPGMYLGTNSVDRLRAFIDGYYHALAIHNISEVYIFDEILSFHDWIALKTHFEESTSGWPNMLRAYYGSEEKALEMFFEHYEEYLNRLPRLIKYLEPKQQKVWKQTITEGVEFTYLTPNRIEVVKYSNDPGMFIKFLDSNGNIIGQEEYALNEKALKFTMIGINYTDNDWVYV